jgi:hypothetical protein
MPEYEQNFFLSIPFSSEIIELEQMKHSIKISYVGILNVFK